MAVREKYAELIRAAEGANIANLQIQEQNNVLYIKGDAPSGQVKDQLWSIYNRLDPDYRSADVVLDVNTTITSGSKAKVITRESNLNIRKGPGTDQPIVGKAAHNEIVTVVSQTDDQWSLIRTDAGEEGYAYNQYLEKQ